MTYVNDLVNVIMRNTIIANNLTEAWETVKLLTQESFLYNSDRSNEIGYKVYDSTQSKDYVVELEDKLKINFANGDLKNIWYLHK